MPHDLPAVVRTRAQPQRRVSFQQRLKEINCVVAVRRENHQKMSNKEEEKKINN